MKKIAATTLVLFFALNCTLLIAQTNAGLIGGLNIADIKSDENTTESVWKWGAGAVFQQYLSESFSIYLEPTYILKGGEIKRTINNPALKVNLSLIEVPVFLRYELGTDYKVYFIAGPAVSFVFDSELEANVNGINFVADIDHLIEDVELNLSAGAGFAFPVSFGYIFLESRYTHGLTDLAKSGAFTAKAGHLEINGFMEDEGDQNKTTGFQMWAGFLYHLNL